MPTKKASKKSTAKEAAVAEAPVAEGPSVAKQELTAQKATRDAKEAALITEPPAATPDPQGDIDQRMAALLKDHQDMGARPK
jgi:hypothetical protein